MSLEQRLRRIEGRQVTRATMTPSAYAEAAELIDGWAQRFGRPVPEKPGGGLDVASMTRDELRAVARIPVTGLE
jgi:hypothetical protein